MTPSAWAGPLLAAAGLLAVAGGLKAWRPHETARALRRAGFPAGAGMVRAVAAVESMIGVGAALKGGPILAGAVSASYGLFAIFVTAALVRGWPLASCGCFGEPDSPPTILHVVIDAAFGAGALAAAAAGGASPLALTARRPGWGLAMVSLATAVAGLAYLALTSLPRLRLEQR